MEIARVNGSMRIASGLADVAARHAHMGTPPSRLRGLPVPDNDDDDGEDKEERNLELLENIFRKFVAKVEAERTARLAGEVVRADFYLRQITFIEICLDVIASGIGDPWELLGNLRRGGLHLIEIAETPMSRLLDTMRRDQWAAMADPQRPEHPPQRYLDHHDGYSTEPTEYFWGGQRGVEQRAEYARRHEEDAAAQLDWEAMHDRADRDQ